MSTVIEVTFPENLKVEAKIDDFTVLTDQPPKAGGDGAAPTPFALFGSSIATCAGYFALKFCKTRKLATDGMKLTMKYSWDKELKRYPKMVIELQLPEGFPEKYRGAMLKSMDQCAVKKHIVEPPEFEVAVL